MRLVFLLLDSGERRKPSPVCGPTVLYALPISMKANWKLFERAPRSFRLSQSTPTKSSNSSPWFCASVILSCSLHYQSTTTTFASPQTLAKGGDGRRRRRRCCGGRGREPPHAIPGGSLPRLPRAPSRHRQGAHHGSASPALFFQASSSCHMGLWMLRLSNRCFCGVRRCGEVLPDVRPR